MAHFAQLDDHNKVLAVVVIANDEIQDANGIEREALGIARCKHLLGADTNWKQTSYNASFRKNYAGIGYTYDTKLNAFIAPQPYPSWTLDAATCQWNAPRQMPADGKPYTWDEGLLRWVALS